MGRHFSVGLLLPRMATGARYSKLQRQVLQLYKQFLRLAKEKPGLDMHVRYEFRRWSAVDRTDIMRIEHLLRRGQRQLDMLQRSAVEQAGTFVKDKGEDSSCTVPRTSGKHS